MQKEQNEIKNKESFQENLRPEPKLFLEEKSKKNGIGWSWLLVLGLIAAVTSVYVFNSEKGIKGEGAVRAERLVKLGATQAGVLKEVFYKKGDFVKEGEVIAKLENKDFERDLEERKLDIEMLKQDKELVQNKIDYLEKKILEKLLLFENGLIGKSLVERVRFEIGQDKEIKAIKEKQSEVVQKQILSLEGKLKALEIRAPFSGILLSDSVLTTGNVVKEGDHLFELADPKSFYLEALVPEKRIRQIQEGDSCRIQSEAFKGQTFYGIVSRIGAKAEKEVEKVFKVKHVVPCDIQFQNIPSGLKSGMRADVSIFPGRKEEKSIKEKIFALAETQKERKVTQ